MEKIISLKQELILITESFPYSIANEDSFILPEIDILKNYFKISIYPLVRKGTMFELDPQIELIPNSSRKFILKLIMNYFIHFNILVKEMSSFSYLFLKFPFLFLKCILHWHRAIKLYVFFNNYLRQKKNINFENIIFYTYWFGYSTNSIIFLKNNFKNIKCITRTHGYDLYFERNVNNYIPFRKHNFKYIDRVFVACDFAKLYLENWFPFFSKKIILAPLGTLNHIYTPLKKVKNKITLVSCSSIDNIKRVDLIAKSIFEFSHQINSNYQIDWHHFGSGPLFDDLKLQIKKYTHKNLNIFLHGHKSNIEIINFYKSNYVDLFITLTISEGGRPVSIQEAMSFGIPILATKTGGIIDIVHHKYNGILLDVEITSKDISNELKNIILINDQLKLYFHENSRKIWEKKCNAIINHHNFLFNLLNL